MGCTFSRITISVEVTVSSALDNDTTPVHSAARQKNTRTTDASWLFRGQFINDAADGVKALRGGSLSRNGPASPSGDDRSLKLDSDMLCRAAQRLPLASD